MLVSFKLMDRLKTGILSPDFILGSSGKCSSSEVLHTIPVLFCFMIGNGSMKPRLPLNFSSSWFPSPKRWDYKQLPLVPSFLTLFILLSLPTKDQGAGYLSSQARSDRCASPASLQPCVSLFPYRGSDQTLAILSLIAKSPVENVVGSPTANFREYSEYAGPSKMLVCLQSQ